MKAQIQFGESLMVIVILVFLLIIGLVFYVSSRESGIVSDISFREDVKGITLARNVLSMPELQCSRRAGRSSACVDLFKIDQLDDLIGARDALVWPYYRDLFGYATITVKPVTQNGISHQDLNPIALYSYSPNDAGWRRSTQFLFTTLYNPVTGENQLAYFNVTRYSKGVGS